MYGDDGVASRPAAIELVQLGLAQVVSGADYLNIHIRPWPSKRTVDSQLQDLEELTLDDYGVCLYPLSAGMRGVRLPGRLTGRPYARAMARGRGTLETAYFEFAVLEQYRNDGRFRFNFGDGGASMWLTDEASDDDDVFERDHVGLSHMGFAYDLSRYDAGDLTSPIERRVAVFYSDLCTLTPEHQRRWETYEVPEDNLELHPIWWGSQMGHWGDAVGPFSHLFLELENLNELSTLAFSEPMFRYTEKPADLGWLLRPSQREWDDFVLQLDKALSDNLRPQFFDQVGIPSEDPTGQRLGTLVRLDRFMQNHGVTESEARKVLEPLRQIRKARQKPAHAVRENLNDRTYIHQQINLLQEVIGALTGVRGWLSSHPACSEWSNSNETLSVYPL
ncbi:hypothetical protein [Frigoribacterium sp. SL97]|uniref:hypothetical protein n=1 Tax=Frigoribacterium sp. SL97 TaxID=2994664 RepID=UPI002271670D|nr:hypothetical protein [Frigoribacterium sp. SL97]WAC53239.1 hypothetical protein OVA02_08430 [Frigoribacterium sp. SL97]